MGRSAHGAPLPTTAIRALRALGRRPQRGALGPPRRALSLRESWPPLRDGGCSPLRWLRWPRSRFLASLASLAFAGLARLRWPRSPSLASLALGWPRSRFAPASLASEKLTALAAWRLLAAGGWRLAARSCSAAWRLLGRASLASVALHWPRSRFVGLGRASLASVALRWPRSRFVGLGRASLAWSRRWPGRASLASLAFAGLARPLRSPSPAPRAAASDGGGRSLAVARRRSLNWMGGQFARGRSRFTLRSPRSRLRTGSESLATLAGRLARGAVRWRCSLGQSLAKRLAGDSRGLVAKVRDSLVTLVESSRRRATGRRVSCAHHEWLGLAGETRALGAGGRDSLVSLVRSVRAVGTRRRELRVHPWRSRLAREASTLSAR